MKERPILFGAPMVRAILEGRKTQTRRIAKPRRHPSLLDGSWSDGYVRDPGNREWLMIECPYGQPGDRLWVRENGWERPERTPRMMREGADTWAPYYYDADRLTQQDREDFKAWGFKRRPSIHMPRWASRILLEVVAVRVERMQDISEADAEAEGIDYLRHHPDADETLSAKQLFECLWCGINGPASWDANPWVWCISFRRINP